MSHPELVNGPGGEYIELPSGARIYPYGSVPWSVGLKGEKCELGSVSEEMTVATGGATTTSTAHLFPAGCLALGFVARITEAIDAVTNWAIGDGSDVDAFIDESTTLTKDTTAVANNTAGIPKLYTADTHAVITTTGSQNTTGKIRVTSFFLKFTAPTS